MKHKVSYKQGISEWLNNWKKIRRQLFWQRLLLIYLSAIQNGEPLSVFAHLTVTCKFSENMKFFFSISTNQMKSNEQINLTAFKHWKEQPPASLRKKSSWTWNEVNRSHRSSFPYQGRGAFREKVLTKKKVPLPLV